MWIVVTAPLFFSHAGHIVLFTSHITGFAVSIEVGTLVGGPEVRRLDGWGGWVSKGWGGWELLLSQTLG